jgi:hypothetical protein
MLDLYTKDEKVLKIDYYIKLNLWKVWEIVLFLSLLILFNFFPG